MNQKHGFILTIIFLFFFVQSFSQNFPGRIKTMSVKTTDGNVYLGTVVSEDIYNLVILTESLGEIKIPQNKIISTTEVRVSKKYSDTNNLSKKGSPNPEMQNFKMEKAKRVQTTGAIMTLTGITACGVGYVLFDHGMFKRYPSTPGHINGDTYSTAGGAAGMFLLIVGIPAVCIGVPVLLAGTAQRVVAKKNLEISLVNFRTPTTTATINGLSLKLRF